MNEIIKCKICGKPFFKNDITGTVTGNILHDDDACDECNKLALKNTVNKTI